MEIMSDSSTRRTLLVLLPQSEDSTLFLERLKVNYDTVEVRDVQECIAVMAERFTSLSAVLIDVEDAEANDYQFLHYVAEKPELAAIPVMLVTFKEPDEHEIRCLDEGAIDFLAPPFISRIMKRRIDNSIRLKRSTTFYEIEKMLRELPSNIFLKDTEGRYVFCTHYWHHLDMGDDPNWTIRGKTDLEIRKDRENAIKAMEADKEIMRTGEGTTYVIEINTDGIQEFMELIKRPVFDEGGNVAGIIALINDVTEHELLKRELEKRARTDELTGLSNRRSYDEFLQELQDCNDFPIAVISCDCDELKRVNDTYGHLLGDEYIRMSAVVLITALPEDARAFRTGGDEFIAFVPHANQDTADEIVDRVNAHAAMFKLKEGCVRISCGTAVIQSADDSVRDVIDRADHAMYERKAERKRLRGEGQVR